MTITYPPPSYLTGLVSPVNSKILSQVQTEYGTNTTAFVFNNKFNSLVQTWLKEFQHYGGTAWGIDTKGYDVLLFDQFKHGYNAMMKLNEEEDLKSTRTSNFPTTVEIIIAFQYSGDESEHLQYGESEFEQDYFGWVIIYKLIDNKLEEIFNYECA